MQDSTLTNLIVSIHSSGHQAVIAVTGGGVSAIGELLKVPGGSYSVLEAIVPYSLRALEEFLGGQPDQYCSAPTARSMAMAAWIRAKSLSDETDCSSLVGIGITASLVSNVLKRGEHRIHVAAQTASQTFSRSLTLVKGARSRSQEEQLAAELLLLALGDACGADVRDAQTEFDAGLQTTETPTKRMGIASPDWSQLLVGKLRLVGGDDSSETIIFPGAFNPLHAGHREMARIAQSRLGKQVVYELSIANVDKPPLDFIEIADRLAIIERLDPSRRVILTTAPTFREKAELFPECVFVVGVDTLVRIAEPKYYSGDKRQRDQAIRDIAEARCRFLVFGRQLGEQFCGLGNVKLPAELKVICDEVPESEFHEDVSSTELRKS